MRAEPWRNCLIELHLHLDGSLSPDMARRLARLGGQELDCTDDELVSRLSASEGCRDLNEYLEKFDFPCSLLQTRKQLSAAVSMLRQELERDGVIYAEIRFAPQKHCERGLSQREVVRAAAEGLAGPGTEANLVLCCMRGDDNHDQNLETVLAAAEFLGSGVVALDLAGAEALFPTSDFAGIFALVRELGVPFTIHAGEAAGPESVRMALSFGASRIGHGVRAAEDPALLAELAKRGVACEICPTSNLNTCVFDDNSDVPLRKLLAAGVPVSISSDNRAVSRTGALREMRAMVEAHHLTADEVRRILLSSIDAAFAPDETKARLRSRVNACMR